MVDDDYWKRGRYEKMWAESGQREERIRDVLIEATGANIRLAGLGAGSTQFLSGSAKKHGHIKGDADLEVVGTNINIEVTGPMKDYIRTTAPLWIRPDKIQNAEKKSQSNDAWVIHCIGNTATIRTIHLDAAFFKRIANGEFELIHQYIDRRKETFYAIPADDACVLPLGAIIAHITSMVRN